MVNGVGYLLAAVTDCVRCRHALYGNECDDCNTNKTALKWTPVQRVSEFTQDTCYVKGGWCSP